MSKPRVRACKQYAVTHSSFMEKNASLFTSTPHLFTASVRPNSRERHLAPVWPNSMILPVFLSHCISSSHPSVFQMRVFQQREIKGDQLSFWSRDSSCLWPTDIGFLLARPMRPWTTQVRVTCPGTHLFPSSSQIFPDVPGRHKGRKRPRSQRTGPPEGDGFWARSSHGSSTGTKIQPTLLRVCVSTRPQVTGIHMNVSVRGEEVHCGTVVFKVCPQRLAASAGPGNVLYANPWAPPSTKGIRNLGGGAQPSLFKRCLTRP